ERADGSLASRHMPCPGVRAMQENPTTSVPCPDASRGSHGVRGFVARERAGEIGLDLFLGLAAILVGELHADARSALALRALRRPPDPAAPPRAASRPRP